MFKRNVVNRFTTKGEEVLFSSYAKKVNLSLYSLGITHKCLVKPVRNVILSFWVTFFFPWFHSVILFAGEHEIEGG